MLDFQKLSCWHQSKTRTASLNSMPSLSNSNRASVRHLAVMVGGLSVLRATWSRRRVQSASTSSLGGSADEEEEGSGRDGSGRDGGDGRAVTADASESVTADAGVTPFLRALDLRLRSASFARCSSARSFVG